MEMSMGSASNLQFFLGTLAGSGSNVQFYAYCYDDGPTLCAVRANGILGTTLINKWFNLTATYDLTTLAAPATDKIKIYLDGVLLPAIQTSNNSFGTTINTLPTSATASSMNVGGRYGTNSGDHSWYWDEARLWNKARSLSEINSDLSTGLVGDEAGLAYLVRYGSANDISDVKGELTNAWRLGAGNTGNTTPTPGLPF
jgi:hypothetical protein